GEGEIAFFNITVTVEQEQLIVGPGRFTLIQYALKHRPDHIPDFGPAFLATLPHSFGMLGRAENDTIGVVIEFDQILPPQDQDREARCQTNTQRGTQTLRPLFYRAKRRT